MKYLLIVRHAKSSWDNINLDDFDRPLNDRGKRDAPEMAKRLAKEKVVIESFLSSPAKRAKKTAQVFVHELGGHKDDIIYIDELYNAPAAVFYKVTRSIDPQVNSVAIFAHNPGVTDFVNGLTSVQIDNMPTCGVFAVKIHSDHWEDIESAPREFWFFNYPKMQTG
ncbi:MAG TPA: histidine phosphatase family protein [Chitinophagaceae bacterium]|jgi:phosphohistidine phosphatase|nr:histidine phosphatase family protein [Chitinophagaceae bacterium]